MKNETKVDIVKKKNDFENGDQDSSNSINSNLNSNPEIKKIKKITDKNQQQRSPDVETSDEKINTDLEANIPNYKKTKNEDEALKAKIAINSRNQTEPDRLQTIKERIDTEEESNVFVSGSFGGTKRNSFRNEIEENHSKLKPEEPKEKPNNVDTNSNDVNNEEEKEIRIMTHNTGENINNTNTNDYPAQNTTSSKTEFLKDYLRIQDLQSSESKDIPIDKNSKGENLFSFGNKDTQKPIKGLYNPPALSKSKIALVKNRNFQPLCHSYTSNSSISTFKNLQSKRDQGYKICKTDPNKEVEKKESTGIMLTDPNDIQIKNDWNPAYTDSSYLDKYTVSNYNADQRSFLPKSKQSGLNKNSDYFDYCCGTESSIVQKTSAILGNDNSSVSKGNAVNDDLTTPIKEKATSKKFKINFDGIKEVPIYKEISSPQWNCPTFRGKSGQNSKKNSGQTSVKKSGRRSSQGDDDHLYSGYRFNLPKYNYNYKYDYEEEEPQEKFMLNYNYSNKNLAENITEKAENERRYHQKFPRHHFIPKKKQKSQQKSFELPEQIYKNNYNNFSVNVIPYYECLKENKLTYNDIYNPKENPYNIFYREPEKTERIFKQKEILLGNNDVDYIGKDKRDGCFDGAKKYPLDLKVPVDVLIKDSIIQHRNQKSIEELYNQTFKKFNYIPSTYYHYDEINRRGNYPYESAKISYAK